MQDAFPLASVGPAAQLLVPTLRVSVRPAIGRDAVLEQLPAQRDREAVRDHQRPRVLWSSFPLA